ncbi:unnamed protein product [Linum tenue]|uniref:Uncharacterized protein n=1 Tax=Linum tenue TaxID=586396 RepID=A0AAV0HUA7_9ROSI|nr:unnamed protein product [Linum tenue]
MTVRNNGESPEERKGYVHSQVLRIREEDSHVGQDFLDVLKGSGSGSGAGVDNSNYNLMIKNMVAAAASSPVMNDGVVVLLMRPMLPSSPLSRKTTVN